MAAVLLYNTCMLPALPAVLFFDQISFIIINLPGPFFARAKRLRQLWTTVLEALGDESGGRLPTYRVLSSHTGAEYESAEVYRRSRC